MKNKIALILLPAIIISCNQQNNKTEKDHLLSDTIQYKVEKKDTSQKNISSLSDTLLIKLRMDSTNTNLTIPVNVTLGKEIFAKLSSSDSSANIRFTQIGLPDSTFDGPFGKDLHYMIRSPGIYKLIIGPNIMAGDRWKGNFELRVWIK